jgi:predicted metal-dependent peptidase
MGRHTKEWNDGYQAAIEAIKKAMSGNNSGSGNGSSGDDLPSDMTPPPGSSGSGSSGNSSNQQKQQSAGSRTDKNNPSQGTVRPEDCMDTSGALDGCPETPGGMISKTDGDKLAQSEGYNKEGGSEGTVERDWKDSVIKVTQKQSGNVKPGTALGNFMAKLEGLYKTQTDWKKVLKKIVGNSISPDDKRQAYANKNILISQDRIARTDKDKYDNLDYMMAWIDSSGSMSDDQLKQCLSEVYAVALAKKPIKLIVIQCDTRIQDIKEYRDLRQLKQDMVHATVKGRGGTELKPCWDLLVNDPKYKRRPCELVMIFTDGGLIQYKRNPRTMKNLCWVILDNPSWNIQYKDMNTKMVHIKTSDIK